MARSSSSVLSFLMVLKNRFIQEPRGGRSMPSISSGKKVCLRVFMVSMWVAMRGSTHDEMSFSYALKLLGRGM